MPSGSKKRKSSKKLKPVGGPPELDVGLEQGMANTEEDVGEPSPSPVGIERDPEAMAEAGIDSKEVMGKALQEAAREDIHIDKADEDPGDQGDPPPLAEPEPEIPAAIEAEPLAANEPQAETVSQQEIPPQIGTPLSEPDAKNDAMPEENKLEEANGAESVDPKPVVDAAPDAPLDEINPDADIGLDEIDSSKQSPTLEREPELDAAPLDSESGIDKSFVDVETEADATSRDIESESTKAADEVDVPEDVSEIDRSFVDVETRTDATPTDIEPESGKAADELGEAAAPEDEPLVEEGDGAPYVAQEADEAPNEVVERELGTNVKLEAEIEESETEGGVRERELPTEAAPTDVETEAEEKLAEESETAVPANIETLAEEAPFEREPETAAPADSELVAEEVPIEREPETAAPTDIEPVTEEALVERELETDTVPVAEEAAVEREAAIDADPVAEEAPIEREPEVDAAFKAEEAPIERDSEIDAGPVTEVEEGPAERELATDVAIADVEPETEAAPLNIDADTKTAPAETDALQDEIDEAVPENETELDVAVREGEPEEDAPVVEPEALKEVGPVEVQPEVSAEPASNEAAPEAEPHEVSEVNAEDFAAPDPEPEGDALVKEELAEDVENSAEIEARTVPPEENESEPKPLGLAEDTSFELSEVIEPELEVEETDTAKLEDEALAETKAEETDASRQDSAEGEGEVAPGINPETEVETTLGVELEAEAVVSPEAEPESAVEAPAETDFAEPEVETEEREAFKQDSTEGEGKAALEIPPEAEVETMHEVEPEVEAVVPPEPEPELLVEALAETKADEKGLIHTEEDQQDLAGIGPGQSGGKEEDGQPQIQASEPGTDELESSVFDAYEPSGSQPQVADALEVPVVEEEPPAISASDAEPKEGDSIPSLATGLEGEGETSSENQVSRGDIDLPLAEVVNSEDLAKEDGVDEEQAAHIGHGEDEAFFASAGNGGEVQVSSEQELGSEQPLTAGVVDEEEPVLSEQPLAADVVDGEEFAKEVPPLNDQELVSEQPQPLSSLESAAGEPEKDIGEEETASSTRAEAGSVLNDADERASFEQELPTDFLSTEQETDVPDSKEFDESTPTSIPEFVETVSLRQLDSEPISAEKVDGNTSGQEEATSEQLEVPVESAEAAEADEPPKDLLPAPVEEIPSGEQAPSLPQPVRQDSGIGEDYTSREVVLANEEPKAVEEEGAAREDDGQVAANSVFPNAAADALISKTLVHLENGDQSIASSEAPSNGVVENGAESGVHQGDANNTDKAEIDAVDSKESKDVEVKPVEADDIPVESPPPISKGRDIKDFEAFRQENTPEASLPVSSQSRDMEVAHSKNAERPSEGRVLKHRSKFLDCCGMFDLLMKKN